MCINQTTKMWLSFGIKRTANLFLINSWVEIDINRFYECFGWMMLIHEEEKDLKTNSSQSEMLLSNGIWICVMPTLQVLIWLLMSNKFVSEEDAHFCSIFLQNLEKYGINIWAICEANTSYAWKMQVFTEKNFAGEREVNQAARVVKKIWSKKFNILGGI